MEVAVKAGDLPKAIAEYETLPETLEGGGTGTSPTRSGRGSRPKQLVAKALAGALKSA